MKNKEYIEYTYLHRKAFKYVVDELFEKDNPLKEELLNRAEWHDVDKMLMYTMLEKKDASRLHREYSKHHMGNNIQKAELDYIEAVIDFECARLTKPDKPLNAFDTINSKLVDLNDKDKAELNRIVRELKIDSSYLRKPDERFMEYISSYLPVTEEQMLAEIYLYCATNPELAYFYTVASLEELRK